LHLPEKSAVPAYNPKTGHVEDYARRTAEKAWAAPEVQAHRHQQEREIQAKRSRDRDGPGMSR
jgi:hypothetical protein